MPMKGKVCNIYKAGQLNGANVFFISVFEIASYSASVCVENELPKFQWSKG